MKIYEQVTRSENEQEIIVRGGGYYTFFKRLFDIFFAFIAIIVLSWLLLIISLLVLLTSKGGALFVDKRIGQFGKPINVLKFRSMYINAEKNMKKLLTKEQYKQWKKERKIDDDPRITKIGKFLRKSSLDELPQLFNIFAGSLSFVGPRPVVEKELMDNYTPYQRYCLLQAKPGLTGYWQVSARNDAQYIDGERQRLELSYLPKRGVRFDFKILLLTIPAVFRHKGAQ